MTELTNIEKDIPESILVWEPLENHPLADIQDIVECEHDGVSGLTD